MIELEALAIVWAMKKSRLYLAGRFFVVVTDHRPLIPVFNDKTVINVENVRLQNYLSKLTQYDFKVQ